MTALDNLMFLIRTETTTDAAFDGAIHVWEQSHPADTGSPSNNIRYSASFDTALALIKRRLPEATVALFVYTSGNAEVEIDVPDRGSDWMVYSSRETPRLVLNPTRATLLAWAADPANDLDADFAREASVGAGHDPSPRGRAVPPPSK